MSTSADLAVAESPRDRPAPSEDGVNEEKVHGESAPGYNGDERASEENLRGPDGEEYPTKVELETLRRVMGSVSWVIYTVAFCELCERFAYYGTTNICKPVLSPIC
jgi:POT family proton-dependent oligopeptide transporter